MITVGRPCIRCGLLALGSVALSASSAATKPANAWREVFQSSPASYDALPPGMIEAAAKQYRLPVAVIAANALPKTATGTLRYRFAPSAGGMQIRVRISNENGRVPLVVSAASLGIAAKGFDAVPGSLHGLTFGGQPGVTIPAGAPVLSDAIVMKTIAGTDLIASVFTPATLSIEPRGAGLIAVGAADQTLSDTMSKPTFLVGRPLITGAEILSPNPPRLIVAFGDSITDGNRTDPGTLRGWPAELDRRLSGRKAGPKFAVVNGGIGGNRLLAGGSGDAALARFDRDVLRLDGVSYIIILEGINDIGMSGQSLFGNNPKITSADLIGAYRQLIDRAHLCGIKVVLGTLLPFGGNATYYSAEKESIRQSVNLWIRTSSIPDAIVDFDQIAQDPANPIIMRKDFNSIDGLHPGPAGYKAMGDAIDMSLFR